MIPAMTLILFFASVFLPVSWVLTTYWIHTTRTLERLTDPFSSSAEYYCILLIGSIFSLIPAFFMHKRKWHHLEAVVLAVVITGLAFIAIPCITGRHEYFTVTWNAVIICSILIFMAGETDRAFFTYVDRRVFVGLVWLGCALFVVWCSVLCLHYAHVHLESQFLKIHKLETFWMTAYTGVGLMMLIFFAIRTNPLRQYSQEILKTISGRNLDKSLTPFIHYSERLWRKKMSLHLRQFAADYFSHVYHPLIKHQADIIAELETEPRHASPACLSMISIAYGTLEEVNHLFPVFVQEQKILEKIINSSNQEQNHGNKRMLYQKWLETMIPKNQFVQTLVEKYKTDLSVLLNGLAERFTPYFKTEINIAEDFLSSSVIIADPNAYYSAIFQIFENTKNHGKNHHPVTLKIEMLKEQPHILFVLEDNGPGIKTTQQLFKSGKGLGEAKSLIDGQGDLLQWEYGSRFKIRIPWSGLFPAF